MATPWPALANRRGHLHLFSFSFLSTTCAASIIMINKFSLPIFDFNLQWVALFTLPSLSTQQTVFLFFVIVLTASLNAMGRFRSSSKQLFNFISFCFRCCCCFLSGSSCWGDISFYFCGTTHRSLFSIDFSVIFGLFFNLFPLPSSLLVRVRHFSLLSDAVWSGSRKSLRY